MIYLDNNSTTQIDKEVLEEMTPYLNEVYGNSASRTHKFGWDANDAVKLARERVSELINAKPDEIIFTSGSTEGINLIIKGIYDQYSETGNHIITVKTGVAYKKYETGVIAYNRTSSLVDVKLENGETISDQLLRRCFPSGIATYMDTKI